MDMPSNPASPAAAVDVAAIVLAAGQGSRFDPTGARYKLLQPLPNGQLIIQAACEAILASVGSITVVCAQHRDEIEEALSDIPANIVHCTDAGTGMGASIRCGIGKSTPSIGWLVMLGDMPYIRRSTVNAVVEQLKAGALIVRPFFEGNPGHPVAFSTALSTELQSCNPRAGLQALINQHASQAIAVETCDIGCIKDIDIPGDLT